MGDFNKTAPHLKKRQTKARKNIIHRFPCKFPGRTRRHGRFRTADLLRVKQALSP